MNLSPQLKSDLSKVLTITVAYVLFNWFLAFYNHALVLSDFVEKYSNEYSLSLNLLLNTLIGMIAGTLGGYFFVFVNRQVFRKRSMRFALLTTAFTYIFVFVVVTLSISVVSMFFLTRPFSFEEFVAHLHRSISEPMLGVFFLLWGFITLCTLFLLQVNDKFGPGILRKFLLGQYHHPKEEQRIFMFLDMRSSTGIAEKIGNEAYFSLLRDCFSELTPPIIACQGEIYQYVGDEIVISWTPEHGFKDANCLRCFSAIQRQLKKAAPYYQDAYGLVPEFKAGLHFGKVIAGEIGDIKKDIVYSGDVLNVTSRIQSLCNRYQENFLASTQTLNRITNHHPFEIVPIGEIELRGKESRMGLQAIRIALS